MESFGSVFGLCDICLCLTHIGMRSGLLFGLVSELVLVRPHSLFGSGPECLLSLRGLQALIDDPTWIKIEPTILQAFPGGVLDLLNAFRGNLIEAEVVTKASGKSHLHDGGGATRKSKGRTEACL